MYKKMLTGLAMAGLSMVSAGAAAAIVNETVVTFGSGNKASNFTPDAMKTAAYGGFANVNSGVCSGCYTNNSSSTLDSMVIGIVQDNVDPSLLPAAPHLHRVGASTNWKLGYHADSTGIYGRAQDGSAFSLVSMQFDASITDENPDQEAGDYWEILGYSSALNPGLDTAADSGSWVARQIVTNGFNGLLTLDSAFKNISAFWIHYHGYQATPLDGKQFGMVLDDIKVNAPVKTVPVPAAVWLFGSGLLGLLSMRGRKTSAISA